MAQRFFTQRIKRSNGNNVTTIVIASIVGILIVIAIAIIISVNSNNNHDDAVIELGSPMAVEINSELPDKTLFFSTLENVKEDDIDVSYEDVDLSKVGTYDVTLEIYGVTYETTLQVVDTESPTLTLKTLTINAGESYSASDFVDSCEDNSNTDCNIEFYTLALSQTGASIDYSSFSVNGTYSIEIVASDDSGNKTTPQTTILYIGENSGTVNKSCSYGDSTYDSTAYIMAVNVTEDGCALDLNLYQSETVLAPVKALIESEETKLKKEFSKINLNVSDVYIHSEYAAILNSTGTGVVGYTLLIQVSIVNSDNQKEVIEEYNVNTSGERIYTINKYL